MLEIALKYIPWIISASTIVAVIIQGNMHPKAWLITIANQSLWLLWIVLSQEWGFLPLNAAMWVVAIRNHIKWTRLAAREVI